MKVVVTGGLGLVGRYVVEALQVGDAGSAYDITVFDQLPGPEFGDVKYVAGDIRDIGQLYGVLSGADMVIHLAAVRRPGLVTDDILFGTNVLGTLNVHEAAWRLGVRRVVSTSSEAALGWQYRVTDMVPLYLPIDEDHPLWPQDAYALSKQVGEDVARSYARRGLETIVLRPPWVVSPEVLAELHASSGRTVTSFSLANYIDVRDLAEAYKLALTAQVAESIVLFVVADDSVISEPLATFMPRMLPAIGDKARDLTGDKPSVANDRAKAVLGWQPTRSWRTSVEKARAVEKAGTLA